MTQWQQRREPPKPKAEFREMLAEAVRNTAQLEPERARRRPRKISGQGATDQVSPGPVGT